MFQLTWWLLINILIFNGSSNVKFAASFCIKKYKSDTNEYYKKSIKKYLWTWSLPGLCTCLHAFSDEHNTVVQTGHSCVVAIEIAIMMALLGFSHHRCWNCKNYRKY